MNLPFAKPTEETEIEYRAIEAALLETARGRWFLAEHGRRARRLDSALLEDAIGRLQASLRDPPALLGQLEAEMGELKSHITDSRETLLRRHSGSADGEANDPVRPQSILKAAESIHDIAWSLQANPFDPKGCETIARNAGQLYAMSQMHAMESQRALDFAAALESALARIEAILETVAHERDIDQPAAASS